GEGAVHPAAWAAGAEVEDGAGGAGDADHGGAVGLHLAVSRSDRSEQRARNRDRGAAYLDAAAGAVGGDRDGAALCLRAGADDFGGDGDGDGVGPWLRE